MPDGSGLFGYMKRYNAEVGAGNWDPVPSDPRSKLPKCNRCSQRRMSHQGYFTWKCRSCGNSQKGDLPEEIDELVSILINNGTVDLDELLESFLIQHGNRRPRVGLGVGTGTRGSRVGGDVDGDQKSWGPVGGPIDTSIPGPATVLGDMDPELRQVRFAGGPPGEDPNATIQSLFQPTSFRKDKPDDKDKFRKQLKKLKNPVDAPDPLGKNS